MCYHENCASSGTHRPVLVLRTRKTDTGVEVRFHDDSKTSACAEHLAVLAVSDYLSPEGLDVLTRHMRERAQPLPNKKHTTLKGEEI